MLSGIAGFAEWKQTKEEFGLDEVTNRIADEFTANLEASGLGTNEEDIICLVLHPSALQQSGKKRLIEYYKTFATCSSHHRRRTIPSDLHVFRD